MATITNLMFRMNTSYNGDAMRQARRDIANLDSSIRSFNTASKNLAPGMKDLVAVALALGPALVPIAGGLLGIGAAAGSAMVSAGATVGIFAVAMMGAIKATVGASSAFGQTNTAIKNAEKQLALTTKGTKGYDEALKKLTEAQKAHEAEIKKMPPIQEKFARSYDQASNAVTKFNNDNAKFTLGPATTMVEAFTLALPKLGSVIEAISPEIQRVADLTKRWVTDGGLDRFLTFIKQYGVPALRGFVNATIDLFASLGQGMRDTGPLGLSFVSWLQDTMAAFRGWSEGGGFQRFLAWLQENKGGLIQTAKDLATFLGNVGTAVNNMSGAAFIVLGTFFKVLASFPPGLLQAMMYAFIGITAVMKVMALVMLVNAAATTVMALATGSLSVVLLALMAQILLVVAVLAAVAVGAYFLVKHWDTVWAAIKSTALKVWGWLKDTWNMLWTGVKDIAMAVWDWLTTGWGQVLLFFMPFGPLLVLMNNWDLVWGTVKSVADDVWQWIQRTWDTIVNGLYTAWIAAISPIVESWNTVWPGMRDAAMNIWNGLKVAWDFLWSGMTLAWDVFWGTFGPTFTAAWTTIVGVAVGIWDILTAAWDLAWSVIQGIYRTAWAILSGAWSVGWTYLTETAKVAWAIFTGAWQVLWSVVTGVWNTFYALFSGIFTTAWNVIVTLVLGFWNMIKAAWDALWKSVTAIFMVFVAIFTGNWSAAWNAIKDAASAIWNIMRTAWQTFLNAVMAVLNGFISTAKAVWSAFWTAVQTVALTFWNALRTGFQTFLTAVQNVWNAAWTAVRTIFQTIITAIMTIATNWWATFRAGIDTFLTFVRNLWNTVWTAIRTFFNTVVEGLKVIATGLWTAIRAIFSAGSTWLRETFWNPVNSFFTKTIPGAFETAKNALGKAWDGIRKLVRDPIQAIVNIVYNNGIVKLWNAVAGVFGADKLSNFTLPAFSRGGSTGAGPGKEKGFPAILHPNEHVWTSREVAAAGGHDAVARMRSQALRGERVRTYGRSGGKFDEGGGILGTGIGGDFGPDLVPDGIIGNVIGKLKDVVLGGVYKVIEGPINSAVKAAQSAVRGIIPGNPLLEDLATKIPRKMADVVLAWIKEKDVAPTVAGGSVEAALTWARSQVGKPYQWGGVGPAGYDCSGFMSAIQNVIMGDKVHARKWATGAFSGSVAPGGWKKSEKAPFMVGITNAGVGHTAGTLNGVNVESSGGVGVRVGGGARGYNAGMFTDWYGFTPSKTAGGGSTPAAAKATAKGMLGGYGWGAHWPALEALWQRESGWRWNADNPSSDAYGIPQALPGSKMASAGKDWKTNGGTQVKWGLGYIKGRYGNPTKANNFQKANNWYARGTHSAFPGWGVVGEQGMEAIKMRGGEKIQPLESMVGNGNGGGVTIKVDVYAPGATHAVVDRLNTELPEKLRMALEQKVGGR